MVLYPGYWSDWSITLTLKMTTAQVVETSVTVNNNSPIQDYVHPDDQTQPFEVTPGFKPFTVLNVVIKRCSVFISLQALCRMAVVWLVLLVICISMQTQKKKWKVNEPLRGELESMVYSYLYNNNNKKEVVWFEFILIYFQFYFVLRYFDLCQKRRGLNKNCLPINK